MEEKNLSYDLDALKEELTPSEMSALIWYMHHVRDVQKIVGKENAGETYLKALAKECHENGHHEMAYIVSHRLLDEQGKGLS